MANVHQDQEKAATNVDQNKQNQQQEKQEQEGSTNNDGSSSMATTETRNKVKSVRWKHSHRVRLYSAPSQRDKINAWYTREDLQVFKKERESVKAMVWELGVEQIERSNFVSCQGLDHLLDFNLATSRRRRRMMAADIVVNGQVKKEHCNGNTVTTNSSSSTTIATQYAVLSREAQKEANARAIAQHRCQSLSLSNGTDRKEQEGSREYYCLPKNVDELSTMKDSIKRVRPHSPRTSSSSLTMVGRRSSPRLLPSQNRWKANLQQPTRISIIAPPSA